MREIIIASAEKLELVIDNLYINFSLSLSDTKIVTKIQSRNFGTIFVFSLETKNKHT